MKRICKFLAKSAIALLLIFGIYESYEFYKQNKIQRKQQQTLPSLQKSFVILITAHNNATYCEKSLNSALSQNYPHFRVVYIDQESTDGSWEKVCRLVDYSRHPEKVTLIQSEKLVGSLASLYDAIHDCQDQEILVVIDGNDFLAHEHVLCKLNKIYTKPSIWMTYGNFLDYPSYKQMPIRCKQIPKNIVFNNSFRSHEIQEMHLKTFYAGLFKQIRKEDLLYKGRFLAMEDSPAYTIPLLEMAGKHASFINDVLYLHTKSHPLSSELITHLKKLPKYSRLKTLPSERLSPNSK
ncbi:MAG: glycosyltransferase family 2 protein [Rhabdochlamydiaceae bacterium]|nr:glycosyltransferase family 2 protein [Rhabdochlamydiaceae bacterium]